MLAGCAKLQKLSRQDENVKWENKLQLLLTDSPAGEDAGKQEVTAKWGVWERCCRINSEKMSKKSSCLRNGSMYRPRQQPAFRNECCFAGVFSPEQQGQAEHLTTQCPGEQAVTGFAGTGSTFQQAGTKPDKFLYSQTFFQGTELAVTWKSSAWGLAEECWSKEIIFSLKNNEMLINYRQNIDHLGKKWDEKRKYIEERQI